MIFSLYNSSMQTGIVTRNDDVWQGHPDVAFFQGYFYVVFRQSFRHRETGTTQIMLTRSRNGFRYSKPVCIAESTDRYNCPRLSVINNNLIIICDKVEQSEDFIGSENNTSKTQIILWGSNNGVEWSSPVPTNITGILPDRIQTADDGSHLIATHTSDGETKHLVQFVWKSERNIFLSNWTRHHIADIENRNLCEGSICNTGSGLVCLMRENSQLGEPVYWSFSSNNGITWSSAKKTRMFGGHRPVLGQMSSGNYLTTYREQSHTHIPGYWAKNTFACWTHRKSMLNSVDPCLNSVILPIDHDYNRRSDSGYTGWVETEDGQIYVVNYVTKDAQKPYIVWYLIDESDF